MNLTIGQYYPTKSIIHDLDSRTKILATILYIVAIFVAKGIVGYGICTLFLGYAIFKSNVPFKMLLRGLKTQSKNNKCQQDNNNYYFHSCFKYAFYQNWKFGF